MMNVPSIISMLDKGLKSFFNNPLTGGISDSDDFESARRAVSNSVVGITLVAVSLFWALVCFFWGVVVPAYVFVAAGICGFILLWMFI